jgi:DNA-binding transcriptional ArsR family regulator
MESSKESSNHLRALAHPVRLRILSLLTGAELSAAEVARELDLTHANASYHLRFLLDAGEVVVSSEESIRGGRAKRYRHPWRPEDRPQGPAPHPAGAEAVQLVVRAGTDELLRRSRHRRPGIHSVFTDAELWVDAQTWARARDLLEEASALLHDGARPPRTEGTELVNLSLFAFVMDAS